MNVNWRANPWNHRNQTQTKNCIEGRKLNKLRWCGYVLSPNESRASDKHLFIIEPEKKRRRRDRPTKTWRNTIEEPLKVYKLNDIIALDRGK